jgi:hypothetical protein
MALQVLKSKKQDDNIPIEIGRRAKPFRGLVKDSKGLDESFEGWERRRKEDRSSGERLTGGRAEQVDCTRDLHHVGMAKGGRRGESTGMEDRLERKRTWSIKWKLRCNSGWRDWGRLEKKRGRKRIREKSRRCRKDPIQHDRLLQSNSQYSDGINVGRREVEREVRGEWERRECKYEYGQGPEEKGS